MLPVSRVPVVRSEPRLPRAVDGAGAGIGRGTAHGVLGEVDLDELSLPAHADDAVDANEHVRSWPPVVDIDHDVTDGARIVVDQEIPYVAEVAVGRSHRVTVHGAHAAQVRIAQGQIEEVLGARRRLASAKRGGRFGGSPATVSTPVERESQV